VSGVVFSADGTALISCAGDGSLILWSIADLSVTKTVSAHARDVNAIALAGPGLVASGSDDKTIKLWRLPGLDAVATLVGHEGAVTALASLPDGKTVISGDLKGSIILWDVASHKLRSYLFDPAINERSATGVTYISHDKVTGQTITYTLPCGSPIPPGSTCVCNCVPGRYEPAPVPASKTPAASPSYPSYPTYSSSPSTGGTICTCDKVCTCVPVYQYP
jgi:WD40 repeat protein